MTRRSQRKSTAKIARDFLERVPSAYVFPIKSGLKAPPCFKDELNLAFNDTATVNIWAKREPECNWGLALKKSGLIVMDVDTKPGKVGQATLDALEFMHGPLPPTFTVQTPSGGTHYYFAETDTVRHTMRVSGFGPDVDSTNYVVVPGCKLDAGGEYVVINDAPIAPAPPWFAEYLDKLDAKSVEQIPEIEPDQDTNVQWAIDYLKRDAPPAVMGRNGEKTLFDVAALLKDRGISQGEAVSLLAEHYNDRCDPPWSIGNGPIADRLDVKVANAYRYATANAPGSDTAEAEFSADPITDAEVNALNARIVADLARNSKRKSKERGIGDNSRNAGLIIIDLDKVQSRNVDFIWPGRLAKGKHTALAGIGGIGKSQITIDVVARIANGSSWPDRKDILAAGWPKELARAPQGYCIVLSAEDDLEDTIKPRLIAAGGNPKFVKFLSMVKSSDGAERKFNLQTDLAALKDYCLKLGNVRLIVIDPASSYMGGDVDASKNTKVRHVLDPITKLAQDLQCSIVSITHFRKGTSAKAVDKVMDSVAFVNAPRAAFGVYDDPSDVGDFNEGGPNYVMLPLKTNLPGQRPVGLSYRIEEVIGGMDGLTDYRDGKPIKTSRIVWQGKSDLTADQVAQMENDKGTPKLDEARRFLAQILPEGEPKPVADVMAAAEAEGLAPDTVKRAKRALKVKAKKSGPEPGAPWVWYRGRELDLD